VLSLQMLPRLLKLDFHDVFSEGLAFDGITANAMITRGVVQDRQPENAWRGGHGADGRHGRHRQRIDQPARGGDSGIQPRHRRRWCTRWRSTR
jgi:hypothetical protein